VILYLDASALVKRYVAEAGSPQVAEAIAAAELAGTSVITRAEVAAALAKAARMRVLAHDEALACLQTFRNEWPDLVRLQLSELTVTRADAFAWEYGLRGYDAVHLAAASIWQDAMGERVAFMTFDRKLWDAAARAGLTPTPADLSPPRHQEHQGNL
jgi:predicted nucleic acid-binding protein